MIAFMAQESQQTLGQYIKEKLGSRSFRALATYAGIGVATASKVINDKVKPDPDTLQKIAEYLDVPVENLYILAGYLKQPSTKSLIRNEIDFLLEGLPEQDQRRIRDQIRVEWEYAQASRRKQDNNDDEEQELKAS